MLSFNWKQLQAAVDHFRYNISSDTEVKCEISVREENFGNNVIGSCLLLTLSYKKPPSTYERGIGEKTITQTIEIFSESELMKPRLTIQETYELNKD